MEVVNADAFSWLRDARQQYDAVIIDFPDPDSASLAKLYSVEFYHLLGRVLGPEGKVMVQSGSPFFAPKTYWSIAKTIETAGYATTKFQVDVPSFGNWGIRPRRPGHRTPAPATRPGRPEVAVPGRRGAQGGDRVPPSTAAAPTCGPAL